jgi:hypothetical protein
MISTNISREREAENRAVPPHNLFFAQVGFIFLLFDRTASAQKRELRLPDNPAVQRFDFEQNGVEKWKNGRRQLEGGRDD